MHVLDASDFNKALISVSGLAPHSMPLKKLGEQVFEVIDLTGTGRFLAEQRAFEIIKNVHAARL